MMAFFHSSDGMMGVQGGEKNELQISRKLFMGRFDQCFSG